MDIPEIKADAAKVETQAKSIWTRYEPYVCLFAGIVIGIVIRHFV